MDNQSQRAVVSVTSCVSLTETSPNDFYSFVDKVFHLSGTDSPENH